METTIQKLNDSQLNNVLFAGKRAIEIYKCQRFRACDGKVYDVWNVYATSNRVRIAVSASSWWNPENVIEWLPSLGEGMMLRIGKLVAIQPNRVCWIENPPLPPKSYNEADVLALGNGDEISLHQLLRISD